ncbi:MAG: hypothetical protein HQL56_02515, partial [Magnetococcales bacterium]|nr:hypothetical protein [Magnetococcales bacterium]
IQQFRFSDGTTWDLAAIQSVLFAGSAIGDMVFGTTAADIITGQAGGDSLYGRSGNDTLLGGVGDDSLNGEEGDDVLLGDVGNDTLSGDNGNDSLNGGEGNDSLYGGAGNDTYLMGNGSGADSLYDYDWMSGNVDRMSVGEGVTADQLWFRRVGAVGLEVSIIGGTDKITLSNWYSGSAYHIEQFKTADGKTLLDSQVDALVSAMATFAPPAAGQTTLPPDYQSALNPVIATNWQ